MERVIFRKEYNPYTKKWGYLACFPDDEANRGRIAATPFHFVDGLAVFEPYSELDFGYYYKKKIIHKEDALIGKLLDAIESYYNCKFSVCEKI